MAEPSEPRRAVDRLASWTLILAVALGLRVVAGLVVWQIARGKGKLCIFGDTNIYWELAQAIVSGQTYQVTQSGSPHYALRTPGYPLFLAACRWVFGDSLLAVRMVQAALGTLGVWLVARLVSSTLGLEEKSRGWSIPLVAASIASVEPYIVGMSALVLSEALFLPLMLAGLWGIASLWSVESRRPSLIAGLTGLAMGGAILTRPSWALFVPMVLAAWVLGSRPGARLEAARRGLIVAAATAAIMSPWWVRNARVTGRFVPTALWVGPSLYDGISPEADGSSAMEFVDRLDVQGLGELELDAIFRSRSLAFAREHPARVAQLAWIKLGRFWSPWPNAETLRSMPVAVASGLVTLPVFGLLVVGAWTRRRDVRALVLLLGPLVYFCGLHLVFVSSIRYRIPGMIPALGLVAIGLGRLGSAIKPRDSHR